MPSRFETEDEHEELFVVDADPSIHVCVVLPKRGRQSLKIDTRFHGYIHNVTHRKTCLKPFLQQKPWFLV